MQAQCGLQIFSPSGAPMWDVTSTEDMNTHLGYPSRIWGRSIQDIHLRGIDINLEYSCEIRVATWDVHLGCRSGKSQDLVGTPTWGIHLEYIHTDIYIYICIWCSLRLWTSIWDVRPIWDVQLGRGIHTPRRFRSVANWFWIQAPAKRSADSRTASVWYSWICGHTSLRMHP